MKNKQNERRDSMHRLMADMFLQEWGKPGYSHAAQRTTPEAHAMAMIDGLADGSASKDGPIVKRCLAALGIKPTYKAIKEWLNG